MIADSYLHAVASPFQSCVTSSLEPGESIPQMQYPCLTILVRSDPETATVNCEFLDLQLVSCIRYALDPAAIAAQTGEDVAKAAQLRIVVTKE